MGKSATASKRDASSGVKIDHAIITCEHAVNQVPRAYAALFRGREKILATHRAYDTGAFEIARHLSRRLRAPLVSGGATRLLVDLNRSLGHRELFSRWTRSMPKNRKHQILRRFYHPYRTKVESLVHRWIRARRRVLHISVHSFTAVFRGRRRKADVGILFDPRRTRERSLARCWKKALAQGFPRAKVRLNYPYRGTADGFTTTLRRRFPASHYLGMELEINQSSLRKTTPTPGVGVKFARRLLPCNPSVR